DNAVIVFIAHHFHLVLFPTNQRFVDKQLVGGRQIQTTTTDFFKLVDVVRDPAAGTTHSERRTNNTREADAGQHIMGLLHGVGNFSAGAFQTYALHSLVKALTVLGFVDGISSRADHFH